MFIFNSNFFYMEFKRMINNKAVNLQNFLNEIKTEAQVADILIGTDSQNYSSKTVYVTAAVFRFPTNGAKVIYTKERVNKIKDRFSRLWGETERSLQTAYFLENEMGLKISEINLDYNSNPQYYSYTVYKAAKGYLEGVGYTVKAKPQMLIASWAANYLCN